jgi:hypothetical protein
LGFDCCPKNTIPRPAQLVALRHKRALAAGDFPAFKPRDFIWQGRSLKDGQRGMKYAIWPQAKAVI